MTEAVPDRAYNRGYRILHWGIALLLVLQVLLGLIMPEIEEETPDEGIVAWHMSVGATILLFGLLRVLWRVLHAPPPPLPMPLWQERAARFAHHALYGLVLAATILGWAGASYFGFAVRLFGVLPLPALAAKGTPWAHNAAELHGALVWTLVAVVAVHIAGALYHQFVLRDRALHRIWMRS
jgi:cytochrome b561